MKTSKYNLFYDFEKEPNQMLAYNVRTNALVLIDKDTYSKLCSLNSTEILNLKNDVLRDLRIGGFIINEDIDELQLLKQAMLSARYNTRQFGITIAPTINCNFECIYCYEKGSRANSKMSIEVQDKIVKLVEQQIQTIDSFSVAWSGGEPLLALDVIERLSKQFIELCNKNNVKYASNIITNGYLLTKDVAKKLLECNIDNIQITLDGPKDIHDSRRPLVGGKGTFDKIIDNLATCSGLFKNVSLRINTDHDNQSRINEVLELIKERGLSKNVFPYLGFVEPTNDCYFKHTCLNKEGFSKIHYNFNKKLVDMKLIPNITNKYPVLLGNFCTADCLNSLVISPEGELYKCWSDIGIKEYCIGSLMEDKISGYNQSRYLDYMLYDPTNDEECGKCICLPICMGGCPRRRQDKVKERCTEYKFMLDKYLDDIANTIYEDKEKEQA